MNRIPLFTTVTLTTLLTACAGPPPSPEPGMEVIEYGRGEEMQLATGVDFSDYTKIILHNASAEFEENWKSNQERLHGKVIQDGDVERIRGAVSGVFDKVMYKTFSEKGGYEMTSDSGPGTMRFVPNIVDLDVAAAGWVQNSIVESLPDSRGRMTVELVVRDSVTDEVLAVAWQEESDSREGALENVSSVNNAVAFRSMSQNFANWVLEHLGKSRE
jgi:hypothetical protein